MGFGLGLGGLLLAGFALAKLPRAGSHESRVAPDVWWTVVGIGVLLIAGGVVSFYRVTVLRRTYVRCEGADTPKRRGQPALRLPEPGRWRAPPREASSATVETVYAEIRRGQAPEDVAADLVQRGVEADHALRLVRSVVRTRANRRGSAIGEIVVGSALLALGIVFLLHAWQSAESSGYGVYPMAPLAFGPCLLWDGIHRLKSWRS